MSNEGLIFLGVCNGNAEVVIRGNKKWSVELANQFLRLAYSECGGAHYHFDKASIADLADVNVVFSLT